jgi:hypothetical protein
LIFLFQGLAGGTLLYITFYEVMERDKLEAVGMSGIIGTFVILLGFAFMTGLTALGKVMLGYVRQNEVCHFCSWKINQVGLENV